MKSILQLPSMYLMLQGLVGARKARRSVLKEYVRAQSGQRILDVGCGPGYVVEYLPDVDYIGVDTDERYIEYAKKRYGDSGAFHCAELTRENAGDFHEIDIAMLNGVIHHISDEGVVDLLRILFQCLRPGGRLITLDGCYVPKMSPISRWMLDNDRGEFVRNESEYVALVSQVFDNFEVSHRNDLFHIPYDALVMSCVKGDEPEVQTTFESKLDDVSD